jgi:hypothetical protein
MYQPEDTQVIPSDSDVPTPTGGKSVWRFAEGEIRTGREGEIRTREKVVGALRRFGVHFGHTKEGEPYGQLEADIETRDEGIVRVKAGLTEKGTGAVKPSVAALSFAEGLLDFKPGEIVIVTANLAAKANRYGKFSTYANLYHYDAATKRMTGAARRPKSDLSIGEKWTALEAELKRHPAYADRPISEADDADGNAATHLSDLCKTCEARGWPTPEQAPAEWLSMAAKAYKSVPRVNPTGSLRDYTDHEWGEIHLKLQGVSKMPSALEAVAARLKPAVVEDYDPFSDSEE